MQGQVEVEVQVEMQGVIQRKFLHRAPLARSRLYKGAIQHMLRWCIAIAAQMTPTYHTAGLRPHFYLPPATSFIQMPSCPRFFHVAILTAVPLVPMPELEADQGPLCCSSSQRIRTAFISFLTSPAIMDLFHIPQPPTPLHRCLRIQDVNFSFQPLNCPQ